MKKNIKCQIKTGSNSRFVRVRIIKAPLVNTQELRQIILARTRALVLHS